MKRIVFFILAIFVLISCQNPEKNLRQNYKKTSQFFTQKKKRLKLLKQVLMPEMAMLKCG
jgi:PBP1b-binding outer membrane lipoprotein LpoB